MWQSVCTALSDFSVKFRVKRIISTLAVFFFLKKARRNKMANEEAHQRLYSCTFKDIDRFTIAKLSLIHI